MQRDLFFPYKKCYIEYKKKVRGKSVKKIGIIFLIGIMVLGMVACNKKSGTDSENTSVSISEPIQPLVYYAPLTGE